jgi:hypothetical protein
LVRKGEALWVHLHAIAALLACCLLPAVFNSFKANSAVLKASDSSDGATAAAAYLAPSAAGISSFKLPKKDIDRRFVLESTQPIIRANGMLRWALNNVAHASTPPCKPVLDSVHADAQWAAANAVKPGAVNALNTAAYWGELGGDADSLLTARNSKLQVGWSEFAAWGGVAPNTGPLGHCQRICCFVHLTHTLMQTRHDNLNIKTGVQQQVVLMSTRLSYGKLDASQAIVLH